MKKFLLVLIALLIIQPSYAWNINIFNNNDEQSVKRLLESQVRYANKNNLNKFISTYDTEYTNSDGLNLETYSKLVQELWDSLTGVKYGIEIKTITLNGNTAIADVIETSHAILPDANAMDGELNSKSLSKYELRKNKKGKWKVVSDEVIDETTSMLYGDAKDLDIKLTVPNSIEADTEYTATLEFTPPQGSMAIASIAADLVEYPQNRTKEVFRAMPEDNILERLFTSNTENKNEYIVASIGLTKSEVCNISIKLSLTGYGYMIRRVNVIQAKNDEQGNENQNADNK